MKHLKRIALVLIISHLSIYLCWSFVVFSLSTPVLETFKNNDTRGFYLLFLFMVMFFSMPYTFPIED